MELIGLFIALVLDFMAGYVYGSKKKIKGHKLVDISTTCLTDNDEFYKKVTMTDVVIKPWGSYEIIARDITTEDGLNNIVKLLVVNPGHLLSLQKHNYRAERWVVLKGEVTVTLGKDLEKLEEYVLHPEDTIYIDTEEIHRIENRGTEQSVILEVQTGVDLREDDIIRILDYYGRIK